MDKIVDLQNLKSKNYMSLSISLKELLFAYWNLLKYESNHIFINNLSLTYERVKALNLMNKEQLHAVSDMICAYQQANIETIKPTKKMCR